MAGRALIVAIENYPASTDLATVITGANQGAGQFFEWATAIKKVKPEHVYVCADGGDYPGANRFATGRESIVDAMAALVTAGQDQTEELFVYFCGHGYCFQESLEKRAIDVLIAADFQNAAASGTKCLKLQEVQEKLYAILGGLHHYYFVDACRTIVHEDEIDPIGLGRKLGRAAQRGRPTKYTLYSTAFGSPAAITSDFSPALVEGLNGKGRAKGSTPAGALWVQFPLLCSYVQQRVSSQKMDQSQDGNGQGLIVEVLPIPTYTCAIEVKDAAAADSFEAKLGVAGNPLMAQVTPFTGPTVSIPFNPGNLELSVLRAGQPLARIDPPAAKPLDFFDNLRLVFESRRRSALESLTPTAPAPARVRSMAGARTEAVNLNTGAVHELVDGRPEQLPAGEYVLTVRDRGMAISRDVRTIEAGADVEIGGGPLDPIRESIVRAVHGDPASGVVAFSETLGTIVNRDLGLWLSLMGASHILADPSTFSKLRELQFDDVQVHPPGSSAIYVLAAVPGNEALSVTVGDHTLQARPVPDLTGVLQSTHPAAEGAQLVTIRIGGGDARTIASFCLPNRLTFIVLSPGARGQLRINQLVLPMFHLRGLQPPQVQDKIQQHNAPLRVIHSAYLFQQQFARSRAIEPQDPEDRLTWDELLYGKWIDPVMSLVACYEILRRGNESTRVDLRDVVVPNLDRYFPGIPDTAAIAAMLGLPRAMPAAAPLFRDGLLAFDEWEDHLPIPADRLDFNYIWTAWRRGRR